MNPLKIYLGLFILLITLQVGSTQKPCYNGLKEKGREILYSTAKNKNFPQALEYFLAAQSCWDKTVQDNIALLIDSTFTIWADTLNNMLDNETKLRIIADSLVESEEKKSVELSRGLISVSAYKLAYESQKLYQEEVMKEALRKAFSSWDSVLIFNEKIRELKCAPVKVPAVTKEAFGNAFYSNLKREINIGHNIVAFRKAKYGGRFLTIGKFGKLIIWNRHAEIIDSFEDPGHILSAEFSDFGEHILIGLKNGGAVLWRGKDVDMIPLKGPKSRLEQGGFLKDLRILTISRDGQACVWDEEGGLINCHKKFEVPLLEFRILENENRAIIRSAYKKFLWQWEGNDKPQELYNNGNYIYSLNFAGHKNLTLEITRSGKLNIHDFLSNTYLEVEHLNDIYNASINPNTVNEEIVAVTKKGKLHHLNYQGDAITPPLKSDHINNIEQFLFSADGSEFLTFSQDSSFVVWSGDSIQHFHKDKFVSVEFAPKHSNLLLSCTKEEGKLWSSEGDLLMNMPLESEGFLATFNSDGSEIMLLTKSGKLTICPLPSLDLVRNDDSLN